LKGIIRAVDRFCYKHPRFGIPNLMICVVAGNILVFLLSLFGGVGQNFLNLLYFNADSILRGQVWRLVTFVFIPLNGNNILFFAISLYFYYFIGTTLERQWGSGKFTIYYLSGIVLLIIYGFVCELLLSKWFMAAFFAGSMISASYLNLSMFFVFATFYPNMRVLFMFFIPVKIKWLAILDLVFFAVEIIRLRADFPINLLPVVCLLHYFLFCGGWLIDYIRPSRIKTKANTVSFKREVKKAHQQQEARGSVRRCAVCGKTEADYPNLEFRYCSRFEGYHCFCEEHIGNHVHF
jgi:hypothetical protein